MFSKASNRRSFLSALAALPGVGALLPASLGAATPARAGADGRDLLAELGVPKVINAAGTYTALTASLMPPEVMAAMQVASRSYCRLDDLHDAVGARIAALLKCEAACVSAGCASALSMAAAACVAGDDSLRIRQIPDTHGMKNEAIIQKSHRNGYDHAVRNAGVRLIEVETRGELERTISKNTALLFYLNSATNDGQIKHEEFVEIGKKYNIPTLIDAAADVPPVENLYRFTKLGFDFVAFSGGKGIRGPQSAGLLLGRKDLIRAARMNASPNSDSVCRGNKVNKEEMVGMLVALEMFIERDHDATWKKWEALCATIAAEVKKVKSVSTRIDVPELANMVPHLLIRWDSKEIGLSPAEVERRMGASDPPIETRGSSRDELRIGVWMMEPGEEMVVGRRIREILESA